MDTKTRATLPKSRSNTRISVLTANYAAGVKPKYGMTSESTRLVYQHGQAPAKRSHSRGSLASSDSGSGLSGSAARVAGLGGAARGYGCYEPLSQQSNPVNACLRAGVAGFGWCMVSWYIGVTLLVIEYARIWDAQIGERNSGMSSEIYYPRQASGPPWLIFAPFWLGDFLALVVLARVLSKIASVRLAAPTRNRGFRRSDGRERSSGSLNELSNGSNAVAVNMDYFPLLQRVVVTALGCFIVLLLVIVEQILACLRWGRATDAGVPGSLALAAPALVLEGLCLLRITLLKTQGLLSAITWGFLLLLTVSVALRSGSGSSFLHSYPWLECLTPLWVLDLLYLGVAAYVAANTCAGRFVMTPTQGVCFLLFVMALIGSTAAELLLTGDKRVADWTDTAMVSRNIYLRLDLPLLLALVSLLAFCLAVFLSAEHSVSLLVSTHGIIHGYGLEVLLIPIVWEQLHLNMLSSRWNKGTSISSMDVGPSEDGYGGYRAYQRTDSGQYVDIYDKL